MDADKLRQYIAFLGGFLGALMMFLQSLGIDFIHLNNESIDAFLNLLTSLIPFVLVGYGIWKNQYILTSRAKVQERELKRKGLK